MIKLAPSILSADFSRLGEEVKRVEKAGAEYLHIDVMDGHFVPNITIGPLVVESLRPVCGMVFDVHLMIEQPDRYVERFIEAGADIVTVHAEAAIHLHQTVEMIKKMGKRAGVALNPSTHPNVLEYVAQMLDLVLVMTVNPGFGGQGFISAMLPKIEIVREMLGRSGSGAEIQVDGGIGPDTAPLVAGSGATVLVAGSAIFGTPDPVAAVRKIRESAESCGRR